MSTLTRDRIKERLESELPHKLVVTPILSNKQIGEASIDVRLSNQFIVFRMHTFDVFEPFSTPRARLRIMQERQIVKFRKSFVLHPGMLALGCTFEYICLPSDVECQVEGRSSWARLGLQIATATSVEPGFKGVLTLELSNLGTIPIQLYPGVRIAQLFFHDAKPKVTDAYGGTHKYECPVGPQFSLISNDKDGKVFSRQANTHDMTFNQIWNRTKENIDLTTLAKELKILRGELQKSAKKAEDYTEIGAIASAEIEAQKGDGPKALSALARAGKWTLSVAEKIGVGVATAAIKTAYGL